jgi:ribosomal protein L11 methyltransferase
MFELGLMCPQNRVESLSDALEELNALSVSVEDADAQTDAEQALFGEPGMPPPKEGWLRSRVSALFASQATANDALTLLQARDFLNDCKILELQELPEQDWVRLTQSQFTPVEITPEFWIVPTWHEPPAQARVVIRLDPGLAFGTGTHPTTRMCLRWIAQQDCSARSAGKDCLGRVLDYGCGSGILAIGAAKHGATDVDAVDIDHAAVDSTVLNAQANQVEMTIGVPAVASGIYQTVLANILATPLKALAPLLWSRVAPGGTLLLSGILSSQADELRAAYAPFCQLRICDQEEGWILMTATR